MGFDVYICYTQSHLQRDGLIASAITDAKSADLMPTGTAVASGQVSHQVIMSFATLLFGIQHRQPDIARHGYVMHGVALRQLNRVLEDATRHTRAEVILAVAALAVSELLVPTGPGNYWAHVMGLERLVDLQDPATFWSTRSPGFCKGVRFMILAAALKLRRPSILARTDWKKAMRTNASYQELEEQDLYDVLADSSVLLAERHAMSPSTEKADGTETKKEQRDDMERRARRLLQHVQQWRQRWDSNSIKNMNPVPDTSISEASSLITVDTIPNLDTAMMLMLYNLALMYVLQSLVPPLSLEETTSKSYHFDQRTRIAAREACRCIQYYLSIGRRRLDASAPPIIHWTVSMASERLQRDDSVEGAWMRDLQTSQGDRSLPVYGHIKMAQLVG